MTRHDRVKPKRKVVLSNTFDACRSVIAEHFLQKPLRKKDEEILTPAEVVRIVLSQRLEACSGDFLSIGEVRENFRNDNNWTL